MAGPFWRPFLSALLMALTAYNGVAYGAKGSNFCTEALSRYVPKGDRTTHFRPSNWIASATVPDHEKLMEEAGTQRLPKMIYYQYPYYPYAQPQRLVTDYNPQKKTWTYFERLVFDTWEPDSVTVEILETVEDKKAPTREEDQVLEGRVQQVEALDEILDFTIPLYEDRRGWKDRNFLSSLREKTYASANVTRYAVVREKTADKNAKGRMLAVLGVGRAAYRIFQFFHKPTQQWVEYIGEAGLNDVGVDEEKIPIGERSFRAITGTGMRMLSMEAYMAKGGSEYQLPRPRVIEDIHLPGTLPPEVARALEAAGADLTKPCYTYVGQILEPTKFAIAKDFAARRISARAILVDLLRAVFTNDKTDRFNVFGQFLYTYNDNPGLPLYHRMGFEPLDESWSRNIDGVHWKTLGLAPQNLWKVLKSPILKNDPEAKDFIHSFQRTLNMVYGIPYDFSY